jgi:hypothetical protein
VAQGQSGVLWTIKYHYQDGAEVQKLVRDVDRMEFAANVKKKVIHSPEKN